MPKVKLSAKHRKFVEVYARDGVATHAAIEAGYKPSGAATQGCLLLQKQHIKDAIALKKSKAEEILDITHQDLLKTLRDWYNCDLTQTIGMTPKQVKEDLPEEIRRLIQNHKYVKRTGKDGTITETVELQFASKEKAMEMIAKHIGFYEKNNIQSRQQVNVMNLHADTLNDLLMNGTHR